MIELWSISDLIPVAQGEISKGSKLCLNVEVDFRIIVNTRHINNL